MYKVFMPVYTKEDYEKTYGMQTLYNGDMESFIEKLAPKVIFVNLGTNTDSGLKTLIPE